VFLPSAVFEVLARVVMELLDNCEIPELDCYAVRAHESLPHFLISSSVPTSFSFFGALMLHSSSH
jgi:hypothetical protein